MARRGRRLSGARASCSPVIHGSPPCGRHSRRNSQRRSKNRAASCAPALLMWMPQREACGALFLHAMLGAVCRERCFAALVDAARTFEPSDCPSAALARLLVVLCEDAMQAVKSADLLLRDGNLSLVILDFQSVPPRQLQGIPANTWHRLQRLAEQTTAAVLVLTPSPMIEAAQVRITGASRWTLAAQRRWRHELLGSAAWRVFPRRTAQRNPSAWESERATA